MTNHEIARRFERIADILEIQGENPFKVKAYRRAAEVIDALYEPRESIEARNGLGEIPGFGEAIVSKTRDFLKTGTTKLYEQIKDKSVSERLAFYREQAQEVHRRVGLPAPATSPVEPDSAPAINGEARQHD